MRNIAPQVVKKSYGIWMSEETYTKFKAAYFEKRGQNKGIKNYDDFINYLIQKDQVPTY
jgi:hypothetical protein